MAKPIITLNGLKIVIMLGMLVIYSRCAEPRGAADGQDSHTARICGVIAHRYYCNANGTAVSVFRHILK